MEEDKKEEPIFEIISRTEYRSFLKRELKSLEERIANLTEQGNEIVDGLDEEICDSCNPKCRIYYYVHGNEIGYKLVRKEYGFRTEEED